jgi:hypothetical protein
MDGPNHIAIDVFTQAVGEEVIQFWEVCETYGRIKLIDGGEGIGFRLEREGYMPINFNRPAFQDKPMRIIAHGLLVEFEGTLGNWPMEAVLYLLGVQQPDEVSTS